MSATTKNYIGYEALVSYLKSERKNWSYCGFLNLNQDIIIASLISLTNNSSITLAKWQGFDVLWYNHFLDEAKKLLKPDTFDTVITEHLQHKKNLQTFWQGIIKKCQKVNQDIIKEHEKKEKENKEENEKYEKENFKECDTITTVMKETSKDQAAVTIVFSKKQLIKKRRIEKRFQKKQNQILEENKDNVIYEQVINDTLPVAPAYENLVIGEVLNIGIDQLKSYINIISKGRPVDYFSSGVFDERIKITKSESNILKGYVILVIGFRRILWSPVEEVISNHIYNKI
ncbi:hypothetical protein GLOIN_2v1476919 [Rhizophagus clarus]|uniref:Uncharacterized protein n=1 Tax=Rhizophagus clarus TaxID=94130 RepID=A0A8H3LHM4_9GLOM|nr:hypothetical protein GLOIN_2v1476919 [Rhizophagus clarus]